ncbi:zeta toxin family protein [Streptomyces sp. HO565]|uniref:zeta toxin family protein n=1 Tax=Streptomyces sp. HO565 TaxID=2857489 RepID=UPI0038B592A3
MFRERIVPDLLEGRASQETPTVVFLVGQPGAGKSRVTELVATQLNRHGGPVGRVPARRAQPIASQPPVITIKSMPP